jgi:environmental stress-induced protein Ves
VALILRAADRRAVPWKNGGGVTREVIVEPPGSDFGSFDWRVSLAEVASAGPFSSFPGVDRHMAVLSGRLGLALQGRSVTLCPGDAALSFPGEVSVHAAPEGGPVSDLNLMVRRERCAARLTLHPVVAPLRLSGEPGTTTLILALAALTLQVGGATDTQLEPLDAALLEPAREYVLCAAPVSEAPRCYRADITPRTKA